MAEIITLATEFASLDPVRIKELARRVMDNHTMRAVVQTTTATTGPSPGPCRG
ncbi:hypothetical protein ACW14Y_42070 (plasmid) [Kitasatospora sp. cg17-2]